MFNKVRIWLYGRLALNSMTAGDPVKAEKWYRRLEPLAPDSKAVLHNLGVILISLKKYDEAERYLLREMEIYGESDIRFRVLGDLYYGSGKRENARIAYGKALNLLQQGTGDRSTEKFLRRRISHCRDSSAYNKAMDGELYYTRGLASYTKGDYSSAFELYKKAVECDSTSFIALNAAGTVLMNSFRDYENARIFFMKALELADIPLIRGNLALAEYKVREKDGAL